MADERSHPVHTISVVIPVYRGEHTLPGVVGELRPLMTPFRTPDGHEAVVSEVILVHDRGPDGSARVIRELAQQSGIRGVWLSRNFGQHAATLAGMSATTGEWIVTFDEDGQHDPGFIPAMLDTAMRDQASVVYAAPTNPPPHGAFRNATSRASKRLIDVLTGSHNTARFNSYRMIVGNLGRRVASQVGSGVYLDVALSWMADAVTTCPVRLREEGDRPSGYTLRALFGHFWRMVLTSGTRLLRLVAVLGALFALLGVVFIVILVVGRIVGVPNDVNGWTSLMIVIMLGVGAILLSLAVIAEYLGVAVNMAMGRPAYVIVDDPMQGPLGRSRTPGQLPTPALEASTQRSEQTGFAERHAG